MYPTAKFLLKFLYSEVIFKSESSFFGMYMLVGYTYTCKSGLMLHSSYDEYSYSRKNFVIHLPLSEPEFIEFYDRM